MNESNNQEREKVHRLQKISFILNIIIVLEVIVLIAVPTMIYKYNSSQATIKKPVIYIYPEEETSLEVTLLNDNSITTSYPKYNNSWKVKANPDGKLVDLESGKELYSLYYESTLKEKPKVEKDGFVVKGEDVSEFLDKALETLGLNYKEREEFIIYWLPELEKNNYNYIRFMTREEIDKNMPISFDKNPDTLIRVWMTYKPLKRPINVEEQKLEKVERKGFTIVEWGANQID